MLNGKKSFFLLSIIPFFIGFVFIYGSEKLFPKTISEKDKPAGIQVRRFGMFRDDKKDIQDLNNQDQSAAFFSSFINQLQKKMDSDEYEELFDEVLYSSDNSPFDFKMSLLLQKWGETAPKHALEKVIASDGNKYWIGMVFQGWAAKDPETAISYFEQSDDEKIRNNPHTLIAIASEYAKFSPEKAWNWISAYDGEIYSEHVKQAKSAVIHSILDSSPEKIPQLVEKLSPSELDAVAFNMGEKSVNSDSMDWMDKLPEQSKAKAEAGRIIGLSEMNLDKIKGLVSQIDEGRQQDVILELASSLLGNGGSDIVDRMDWIIDSVPEEKRVKYRSGEIEFHIWTWLRQDRAGAREWIESLPPGNKKSKFEALYNQGIPTF